jgi:hypothetical protein
MECEMNLWLQLLGPVTVTVVVLACLRSLYFWQRNASFIRRERHRKEQPAERLDIPAGTRKPEQYDGAQVLHEAQWTYIGRAVKAQGKYFASGILAAVLAPMALFLLSFQLLARANGGSLAFGLILAEIVCLILLVYLAITSREPTGEWVENRARTELFRREQYLFLAGVGPYLLPKHHEIAEEALRRRGEIEGADTHALIGLVPMQERSGFTWLESLHHRGSVGIPDRSDFIDRMESYLYYRIGKQLVWFANEIRDIRENERMWSRILTGALLAAIGIAAVHAFHMQDLITGSQTQSRTDIWRVVIGSMAIVLPPLGTAFLSIRAMYNFRGRIRIYEHEKHILHTQRGALEALVNEARHMPPEAAGNYQHKIDFNFRAIALRTEQSLSLELEQWMLLMERPEHEVAP